jgi:hypothetical protein
VYKIAKRAREEREFPSFMNYHLPSFHATTDTHNYVI